MRIGKLSKRERIGRNYPDPHPKIASRGLIVGEVSTNVINSVYLPLWEDYASASLQQYINDEIEYDEAIKEAESNPEGNVTIPEKPKRPPFHSQVVIDDFKETLEETSKHFSTLNGWKVHANAAKFERQLDEKYGVFRPFITNHPEIETFVRSMQRKWAMGYFSPFRQNGPPIARSTSIVILFMMQRNNVSWQVLLLSSLFLLVGLQPWVLVVVVAIFHRLLEKRRRKVMGKMDSPEIPAIEPYYRGSISKEEKLFQPVGQQLTDDLDATKFDTMILGEGPNALYTAALVSRAGRKVLVLSSRDDASGCLNLEYCKDSTNVGKLFRQVPFDVESSNIARVARQQELLAPALCTSTDHQGGIRFAQIGSEADGYAFEILSIPGMGTSKPDDEIPFVLRTHGGMNGLMDDAAAFLGDGWPGLDDIGNSLSGAYIVACQSMNSSASEFYMSKAIPESANDFSKSTYQEASIRYASGFLDKCFPLNAHLRSLFSGIGMKGENIKPSKTSMAAHVSNICGAVSGEGMFYPIGGTRALCHALATVVEQCGGKIVTGVNCKELIFEEEATSKIMKDETVLPDPPLCLGVKLMDDRKVVFPKDKAKNSNNDTFENVVVTTSGFIDTYIRYMSPDIRQAYKVPRGLPALTERRPHFKVLFALQGTAENLNITGADFYRLPHASIAFDEVNQETGAVTLGVIGGKDEERQGAESTSDAAVDALSAEPSAEIGKDKAKLKKSSRTKYYAGESWVQISFPSAKDPSFANRHGDISTCVVTIEADDEFVTLFDTKPAVFVATKKGIENSEAAQRLMERVKKDLINSFPQLENNILHCEMRGPFSRGLSHTPERFAAKGIRADTAFPNLFVGGSDLTVGDSFSGAIVSGWLTANTIMGYTTIDHVFLKKSITSDLERFIESPADYSEVGNEDVAVPYVQKGLNQSAETHDEHQTSGEKADSKKDK